MLKTIIISTEDGLNIMGGSDLVSQVSGMSELMEYRGQEYPDNDFKNILDAWEAFRQRKDLATRYNNPEGFFKMLVKAEKNPEQPFALVFFDEQDISAVVMATVKKDSALNTVGPVKLPGLKMRSMSIGESGFIHDGAQTTIEAVKHVLDGLVKGKALDFVEMFNVLVDSSPYRVFNTKSTSAVWNNIEVPQVRWVTQLLDKETGERLNFHSKKTRYKQRRQDKLLVEAFSGEVNLVEITQIDQIDRFIEAASNIVEQTYQASLGIGVRKDDESLKDFLVELAEKNYLRAYLLEAKGEAISYALGDVQSGVYHLWATSFIPEHRKLSPGTVLLIRVMNILAEEGVRLFDFGYGDSAYKRILGSHMLDEADIRIYSKRPASRVNYLLNRGAIFTEGKLRRMLAASGGIDRARRFWRGILAKQNQ